MNLSKLFERQSSDFEYILYKQSISQNLNVDNVLTFTRNKVKTLFDIKNEQHFLRYRFEIIKQFIKDKQRYNKQFVSQLELLLDVLFLRNEINAFEVSFINHINSVVFSKTRNLKNLIIDFPLEDKYEKVFYRFDQIFFEIYNKNSQNDKFENNNVELYISTRRVIINSPLSIVTFKLNEIKNYYVSGKAVFFETNEFKFILGYNDPFVVLVSIERVMRYIGIE